MGKLQADLKTAQDATTATYADERAGKSAEIDAEAAKLNAIGAFQAADAQRQENLANINRAAYAQVEDQHAKYLQGTNQLINDVQNQKIDPNKFMHDGGIGMRIAAVIGGALGGFLQGSGATKDNEFLKNLHGLIDRDIAAQKSAIDEKRNTIAARESLYGQMRQQFGDTKVANEASRIAMLTASENRLKSMLSTLDSPVMQARGKEMLAAIDRSRGERVEALSGHALSAAQQEAAAWAHQQAAAVNQQWDRFVTSRKLDQADREIDARGREAALGRADSNDKDVARRAQEYAHTMETADIPASLSALRQADSTLDTMGTGDVAGFGVGASTVHGFSPALYARLSPEGAKNIAAFSAIKTSTIKRLAGANLQPNEEKNIGPIINDAETPEQLRLAINMFRDALATKQQTLAAGAGADAVARYSDSALRLGAGSAVPPTISGNQATRTPVKLNEER